ncbi:phosphatidylinositol-3,5-bisphosphate 3-phosphatase MTMR3-like [Rhinophrynus dorsalis]
MDKEEDGVLSCVVPLLLIESVECRDPFQLLLTCKDCKVIRCQFFSFEQVQEWQKHLNAALHPPSRIDNLFSFAYHAWCMEVYASEKEQHGDLCRPGDHVISRFKNEVERMGFDMDNASRISNINEKFRLCSSYPQELIIPACITDQMLESVASFRSWKRIPVVVYRHQSNGAVISRCGQPEVSWWGWRNADDENLVQAVAKAFARDTSRTSQSNLPNGSCPHSHSNGGVLADVDFESALSNTSPPEGPSVQPQKLLILDARSYAAAVANRAKGGGCECPEYYPNCEVVFMGMANIHSIRKIFRSLRLCTQMPDPANLLSALEGTKWLQHLSMLLKSSLLVVHALDRDQRPVLVHCSDGWDCTPQIVALSKLLLDPYYRSIEMKKKLSFGDNSPAQVGSLAPFLLRHSRQSTTSRTTKPTAASPVTHLQGDSTATAMENHPSLAPILENLTTKEDLNSLADDIKASFQAAISELR